MARPRGFISYHPQEKALNLIEYVQAILSDYADILPLTLRQVFYILVTQGRIEKTEKAYKNDLLEVMNKARRARLIPMDAIRDDGFTMTNTTGWSSEISVIDAIYHTIESFSLDRQINQNQRIVLWCEANGMVPQLKRVADDYSVQVLSSGGFDSLTSKHMIGKKLAEENALVLHIGDHDPSGVHMYKSLDEDISAFCEYFGGDVEFIRLAVTPKHVEKYNLPTAPSKETDKRSFSGLTTQAEALDPRTLATIVRTAIEENMDLDILESVKQEETDIRRRLMNRFQ